MPITDVRNLAAPNQFSGEVTIGVTPGPSGEFAGDQAARDAATADIMAKAEALAEALGAALTDGTTPAEVHMALPDGSKVIGTINAAP